MNTLRPFFLLLGRASVFWIGLFTLVWISILVAGFANPEASVYLSVDALLVAALGFPAAAGWLCGLVVQEFEHTSFARFLPRVQSRLLSGFLVVGLAVCLVTQLFLATTNSGSPMPPLLFVLGLGAYCAGGVLLDPLSNWISGVNVIVVLLLVARSREVARLVYQNPWLATVIAVALGARALHRLFARSTFRRKPFRLTKPIPGRFSFERTQKYDRKRSLADRPKATGWRRGYLGNNSWAWVRAAVHESRGAIGWRGFVKTIGGLWGLGLLVLIHAWVDRGEFTFGDALVRSVYDTLFRSPHVEPFGEKGGLYALVVIVIAALGAITALFKPVALGYAVYPLSRRRRAQIAFRAALVDAGRLLFVLGPFLFVLGQALGWIAGHPARFDFMPFYFRVLMVTVILMPLAHRGRFWLAEAGRRKVENTVVAVAFGLVAFVVAVAIGVFLVPLMFSSAIVELAALAALFMVSMWLYRSQLIEQFESLDLA